MTDRNSPPQLFDSLSIIKSAPDLYLILNPNFEIVEVSDAYLKATMVARDEIIGRDVFQVFPDNPNDPLANGVKNLRYSLEKVVKLKIPDEMSVQKYDIRKPKSDGGGFEERYWRAVNTPVLENDFVQYIIHRVEDITEIVRLKKNQVEQQKVAEDLRNRAGEMKVEIYQNAQQIHEANQQLLAVNEALVHIAYFDTLTGLANRTQLTHELKQSVVLSAKEQIKMAVLFLDLDQFKMINDTLGHKVGDQLLQIVAKRILTEVHKDDVVARLGGDEFVILLNRIKSISDAGNVAQRILRKISDPIVIDHHKLFITGSIGISSYPENGDDEHSLLKHADIAMYCAKQSGRNNFQFCTPEMINNMRKKRELEVEIREAITNKSFILNYQPQIDLKTGLISGVEALIRLPRADGSILLPKEFICVAEETNLIIPLGEWVLNAACTQYKSWEKQIKNIEKNNAAFKLSVNISARQLKDSGFLEMVQKTLQELRFDPTRLEFEVTENPIINDVESGHVIEQLKNMGISIALDDFGVGYSSLNYLRQFHINTLKIDHSLIRNVPGDETDSAIITSIISMAHAMQISITAEGVETKEQTQFLIDHECDKIQSYYFSRPISAEEMTKILGENRDWIKEGISR